MRSALHSTVAAFAVALILTACTKPPSTEQAAAPPVATGPSAPESVATARQVMLGLVIPAADIVWGVANEPPADDATWEKIQANAVMIAEAGGLLMTGARVVDQSDWMNYAKEMANAATAAAAAAGEKNLDKVSEAGNTLYETCDTCHRKYMAARQGQ